MRRLLLVAILLAHPAVASAQDRTALERTVAGAPVDVVVRILGVFADFDFSVERAEGPLVVAEIPIKWDMGARSGSKAFAQATLIPIGADSTRVVITGRLVQPRFRVMSETNDRVTDSPKHPTLSEANRQAWTTLERVAAAIALDSRP